MKLEGIKKRIVSFLVTTLALMLFVLAADLLLVESLDTDIIIWQGDSPSFKVRYFVPYTGGGTSECYPLSLLKFKAGQKVIIKRSLFLDVCIVIPRSREAIDKKIYEYWFDRHKIVD